jgi:hypothetical protein
MFDLFHDFWQDVYLNAPPITFIEYCAFVVVGTIVGLWIAQACGFFHRGPVYDD